MKRVKWFPNFFWKTFDKNIYLIDNIDIKIAIEKVTKYKGGRIKCIYLIELQSIHNCQKELKNWQKYQIIYGGHGIQNFKDYFKR